MPWAKPPVVCEKEDAHRWPDGRWDDAADEDCAFCSVLMQYLAEHPGAAPATLEEAEAIRAAAGLGPLGPASSADTIRGCQARYSWAPTQIPAGSDVLLSAFAQPGVSAAVSGKPSSCSTGNPFKRWLPTYLGGHKVYVSRIDDTERLWLQDPEGPKTGYSGEWVTRANLIEFVRGGTSHTIAKVAEVTDVLVINDTTPKIVTSKTGAVYYDPGSGAVVTKESLVSRTVPSPYGSGTYRLVSINTGGSPKLLGVKPGDPAVTIADTPPTVATEQQLAAARSLGFNDGKTKAAQAAAAVTEA